MAGLSINVAGKSYPARVTMGALLRFKRETGREASDIGAGDTSDSVVFMWCCAASACAADGVPFPYSLMDFADRLTDADMREWAEAQSMASGAAPDGEKKSLTE